jgi:Na+:H+ antiporter, NhaA family
VIALIMWLCVLKSGVHATLVGVALAFCLPYAKTQKKSTVLTANNIETSLMPWVNYFILPLFAFANAGIPFSGMQASQLLTEIPLAIMLGLFIGKPLGIFSFCWISNCLKWTKIPNNLSNHALLGIACLCGIGFTMSLFIGTLAFQTSVDNAAEIHALLYSNWVRLGVLSGSFLSGIAGYSILQWVLHKEKRSAN